MKKNTKEITVNGEKFISKSEYDLLASRKAPKVISSVGEIPFEIGGKYFIRTVTYFATGRVAAVKGQFLVLEDAAWVADTGRFRQAITDGILSEVEPVDVPMFLNISTITDAFVWTKDLPRDQK